MLVNSAASSKQHRVAPSANSCRSAMIARLKMYNKRRWQRARRSVIRPAWWLWGRRCPWDCWGMRRSWISKTIVHVMAWGDPRFLWTIKSTITHNNQPPASTNQIISFDLVEDIHYHMQNNNQQSATREFREEEEVISLLQRPMDIVPSKTTMGAR